VAEELTLFLRNRRSPLLIYSFKRNSLLMHDFHKQLSPKFVLPPKTFSCTPKNSPKILVGYVLRLTVHVMVLTSSRSVPNSDPTVSVILCHIIISYHIVDLKRQNRLKAETDKTKLKVKMRSVSDDVRKRLVEKPRRKVYSNCEGVTSSGRTGRSRSLL